MLVKYLGLRGGREGGREGGRDGGMEGGRGGEGGGREGYGRISLEHFCEQVSGHPSRVYGAHTA